MERKEYTVQHNFEKGFPLSNCVLYRLHWYERSNDIWGDLKKCIEADGYLGAIMNKWDVVRLFIGIAEDWNNYAANKGYNLIRLGKMFPPGWMTEGYKKYDAENPELLTLAMEILEIFALDYDRAILPLKKPHFSKQSPLKPVGYKNGRTYTSANRHVNDFKWAD
jgi:hypothetical protein